MDGWRDQWLVGRTRRRVQYSAAAKHFIVYVVRDDMVWNWRRDIFDLDRKRKEDLD